MKLRNLLITVVLLAAAAWTAPAAHAAFSDTMQRHVVDEGKGFNAQTVAIRVGRSAALTADRPAGELDVVPRPGSSICDVEPLGLAVRCDTEVVVEWLSDGHLVTVTRSGDSFTFDSRLVR